MSTSTVDKGDDGTKSRRPGTKSQEQTVDVVSVATANEASSATELVAVVAPAEDKGAIQLLQPSNRLPNNRPIGSTGFEVFDIMHIAGGDRPITAGTQKVSSMFHSAGDRPVMTGTLKINEIFRDAGDRPVASNDIDNNFALMGFLD